VSIARQVLKNSRLRRSSGDPVSRRSDIGQMEATGVSASRRFNAVLSVRRLVGLHPKIGDILLYQ